MHIHMYIFAKGLLSLLNHGFDTALSGPQIALSLPFVELAKSPLFAK